MAKKKKPDSLFRRLTRLFRSGPVVKRKIRALDTAIAVADKTKSSGTLLFQKSLSPTYATITANAYNLSERLMRYQDFQEMEYCVHGGQLIAFPESPDGFIRIDELAAKCAEDPDYQFIVYAYDHERQQIVPTLGKQARQTRVDHAWKVTFDTGKEIIASANHRLMLRDGTYCKVEDLEPDMAMMPFHRKDLFAKASKGTKGYRWIYTMNKRFRGWTKEHQLIAEFVANRKLEPNEVVHHRNFIKTDNTPSNLEIMTASAHSSLHAKINNIAKWSNPEWVAKFKRNHSRWMTENNPVKRHDITFGRVLETAERVGFSLSRLSEALDADYNVIKRRLHANGFSNFETFAKAYQPGWQNGGWDNSTTNNPRYDQSITFERVCSTYKKGMSANAVASVLNTSTTKVVNRVKHAGFGTWGKFTANYCNHKVVSIEYHGEIPLYDLTVDGYKNFATDSVISHNTPEIASALDIYSDEACAQDDKGQILHVFSDNEKIRDLLEELFYGNLNIEFNLRNWVRNLVKYGDFFLYNDVHPEYGVVNAFPIPVNEIEREENYDPDDPFAIRFRWVTLGNRTLENWEVSHFRLLGNDMFLPYGSSVIEPARRIWRQLILIEDAMLVYRVVRAPDRRVFYIDVGNVAPSDVEPYVEEQKKRLRNSQVIDNTTGRVDLRYNPLSVDEDYIIPVRGSESATKIDTLAGGTNVGTVEDVEYIQKKLFSALKIPRAYLGYDEMLSSKATLAQEDIRFSRTVNVIQKTMIAELNKLAIIHLYANGYVDEDLVNFKLALSNPSTVAQQQKLELWRAMFEIAGSIPEGMGSKRFIYKRIWNLVDEDIEEIDKDRLREKLVEAMIEGAGGEGEGGVGGGAGGGADLFGGGDDFGGEGEDFGDIEGGDLGDDLEIDDESEPPEENAGEEPEEEDPGLELLISAEDFEDDNFKLPASEHELPPIKATSQLRHALYNRSRRRTHGASKTHEPDFVKMTGIDNEAMRDPFDNNFLKSLYTNPMSESSVYEGRRSSRSYISPDMQSILQRMKDDLKIIPGRQNTILSEGEDVQAEIDAGQISESHESVSDLSSDDDDGVVIIKDYDLEDDEGYLL